MKILAVDFGEKRIGLAVGNTQTGVATPIGAIARRSDAAAIARLATLALEHEVERVIIGYPLNMDGTAGPFCSRVERFATRLGARLGLGVELVDERLSSREAEQLAAEIGVRPRRQKTFLDSLAAQVLLRGYLEAP